MIRPSHLLRGAAFLLSVVGTGIVLWFVDKAWIHPWERVSQSLQFWVPFMLTVVGGLILLILLFLAAARRHGGMP